MINSISGYGVNQPIFKHKLQSVDMKYKHALVAGIQDVFQFTPKLENLDSIVTPNQLKTLLKRLSRENFSLGKVAFRKEATIEDFNNILDGTHCVNLHIHTNNSDGSMNVEEYLDQASKYGDKLALINKDNKSPYYISSITDHNNVKGVQKAIAQIAEDPKRYKNFKFVPGCEFMFLDDNSGFKYSAFEALGFCFNPFDAEILEKLGKFNPVKLIQKIKEFGGILSYAHPVRHCQGNGVEPVFVDYLKKIGINGIETNYQYLTFEKDKEVLDTIEYAQKIAKKNQFWETGGTDTHSGNIFTYKAQRFMDKLL